MSELTNNGEEGVLPDSILAGQHIGEVDTEENKEYGGNYHVQHGSCDQVELKEALGLVTAIGLTRVDQVEQQSGVK